MKANRGIFIGILFFGWHLNGAQAAQSSAAASASRAMHDKDCKVPHEAAHISSHKSVETQTEVEPTMGRLRLETLKHRIRAVKSNQRAARFQMLSAIQKKMLRIVLKELAQDSSPLKLKKRNAMLALLASQARLKEALLQAQYDQRKELETRTRAAEKEAREKQKHNEFLSSEFAQIRAENAHLIKELIKLNAAHLQEQEKSANAQSQLQRERYAAAHLHAQLQAKEAQNANQDAVLAEQAAQIARLKQSNEQLALSGPTWLANQQRLNAAKNVRRATVSAGGARTIVLGSPVPSSLNAWLVKHEAAKSTSNK